MRLAMYKHLLMSSEIKKIKQNRKKIEKEKEKDKELKEKIEKEIKEN